jgi:hypothetical protein
MPNPPTNEDRFAKAQRIARNPAAYKVCEGCDSIIGTAAALCPNCHSFRFDPSPSRVVDQALLLGAGAQKSVTAEDLI